MSYEKITNAWAEELISGSASVDGDAGLVGVIAELREFPDALPVMAPSCLLQEFLGVTPLASISPAAPRSGERKRKMLSAVGALVATASGKIVLGTAVAAASVGGVHAADVVDVPGLPDVVHAPAPADFGVPVEDANDNGELMSSEHQSSVAEDAGRPENPGEQGDRPEDAGRPENPGEQGQRPEDAGRPENPGEQGQRPEDAGRPENPGEQGQRPEDAGAPDHAGHPLTGADAGAATSALATADGRAFGQATAAAVQNGAAGGPEIPGEQGDRPEDAGRPENPGEQGDRPEDAGRPENPGEQGDRPEDAGRPENPGAQGQRPEDAGRPSAA